MADESLNWQDRVDGTHHRALTPNASANRIKPAVMPDGSLRIRVTHRIRRGRESQ